MPIVGDDVDHRDEWPDGGVATPQIVGSRHNLMANSLQARRARRRGYRPAVGPIERRIRNTCSPGLVLSTPTGRGQFSIARIDDDGIVLLLGAKEAWTPLSWEWIEGIGKFLASGEWFPIGSKYESSADLGTLDAYLKGYLKRATAGWVAVVLEHAGVVEIDRRPPARVRLLHDLMVR